ncbi:MAG: hypothetical protein KI793_22020, partial [Rivularia sp. (in: Bacteria)]|nr:hypothetical protein [Rivularia sp. MS3]
KSARRSKNPRAFNAGECQNNSLMSGSFQKYDDSKADVKRTNFSHMKKLNLFIGFNLNVDQISNR